MGRRRADGGCGAVAESRESEVWGRVAGRRRETAAGRELERDGKGRKAASAAETRRGATRKDDEGRRGSRTAALNAVPSDRQHRLLRGSSARYGCASSGRSLVSVSRISGAPLASTGAERGPVFFIFSASASASVRPFVRRGLPSAFPAAGKGKPLSEQRARCAEENIGGPRRRRACTTCVACVVAAARVLRVYVHPRIHARAREHTEREVPPPLRTEQANAWWSTHGTSRQRLVHQTAFPRNPYHERVKTTAEGCNVVRRNRLHPHRIVRRSRQSSIDGGRDDGGARSRSSDSITRSHCQHSPRHGPARDHGINARPNTRGWTSCRDDEEEEEKETPGPRESELWPSLALDSRSRSARRGRRGGSRRGSCDGGGGRGQKDPSAGSGCDQLDWTASRVLVVGPGVVGATTGAGVGLPLLLLVVAVLGNQTCTTTAAPVVSDPYVSLDAAPPRLLPRLLHPQPVPGRASRPFPASQDPFTRHRDPGGLEYRRPSSLQGEQDGAPYPRDSTKDPTREDTSPGGSRGGRGGGLARERTESGSFRSLLDAVSPLEPHWLVGRLPHRPAFLQGSQPRDSQAATGRPSRTTEQGARTSSFRQDSTVPRFPDQRRKDDGGDVGVAGKDGGGLAVFGDGGGEVRGGGGGGVVEWATTTVAGPMSAWSYPEDEEPGAAVKARPRPAEGAPEDEGAEVKASQGKGSPSTSTTTTTTTQLPPPGRGTSMDALSASGYIVSVVLVLVVGGALVGVLATVSHHLHHRRLLLHEPASASILHHHRHHHHRHHHHHREELPASHQRRLLLQDHHRHPGTPMLSVSPGMEVGSGGHGGLGGGLEGDPSGGGAGVGGGGVGGGGGGGGEGATEGMQEAMVAAARDRAIRAGSVRQDLALDLPPRLQLPDGEERPYGAHTALHLRDPEQESEIYQKCVRPPPNRTVFDSESPPPYRSQSALLDAPERIVRCHSAGSSLLRVFRKFPSPGSSTPAVVVPPRRPTLSSYSESSSNLSNLSSLTVVPCETDESQQQQHHHHHQQQHV